MSNRDLLYDEIDMEAMGLDSGDSIRISCPVCKASDEKSMKITKAVNGTSFKCFRGKCGAKGHTGGYTYTPKKVISPRCKPYTHTTITPTPSLVEKIKSKWGLTEQEIRFNGIMEEEGTSRIVFPLYNNVGDSVGTCTKETRDTYTGRKSYIFWNDSSIPMHYPRCNISSGPIVLVEDILSSIRVARYARCRAMVGTSIHPLSEDQLYKETPDILLGLDNDMVSHMINLKRKLIGHFNVNIIVWPKDPKDMEDGDIKSILEKYL